jgi:catechol 2,3-dioxygenase-like lactoylglutathione lyase family enzyme
MTMKIMRVESLVYGVEDLETGMRYYDDWGLKRVDQGRSGADYHLPSGQTIKLRSATDTSLPPAVEGGSTVRETVWGVDNQASLDAIGAGLSRDQKVERGTDGSLHAKDPVGQALSFQVSNAVPTQPHAPDKGLNHPFWPVDRVHPLRMGHAVYFTPSSKLKETSEFYRNRLGFRMTESVKQFGDFMRCAGSPDHHNLFLISIGEKAGFNHVAFELNNFDEIMTGGRAMEGKGWTANTKPGRHIMGSNIFWYFKNPSGGATEYFSDMDVFDDNWQPKYHEKNPGYAHWMMP